MHAKYFHYMFGMTSFNRGRGSLSSNFIHKNLPQRTVLSPLLLFPSFSVLDNAVMISFR